MLPQVIARGGGIYESTFDDLTRSYTIKRGPIFLVISSGSTEWGFALLNRAQNWIR